MSEKETSSQDLGQLVDIEKELLALREAKLTEFNEASGHYELPAQRSCFVRCLQCVNFSEMDSYLNEDDEWVIAKECQFCVQRAIDMLGFFEHKKAPVLSLHDTPKKRKRTQKNDLYSLLERLAEADGLDVDH